MSNSLSSDIRLPPCTSMLTPWRAGCNICATVCSYERWVERYADQMTIALAVDLGGTKVESALIDHNGELLEGTRFREATGAGKSSAELEAAVTDAVRRSLETVPEGKTLAGVGIGAAGPIDEDAGLVSPLNLPAWRNYPLKQHV